MNHKRFVSLQESRSRYKPLHVLLSQAPEHEMFLSTHLNTSLLKLEVKQIVMLPTENKQGLIVSI